MPQRTVLLVSADEWGWTNLRRVVQEIPDLILAGEAKTACDAVQMAQRLQPDIIISPAELNGESTRYMLRQLQTETCPTALLIRISTHLDPTDLAQPKKLRLAGQLLWSELTPTRLRTYLVVLAEGNVTLYSRSCVERFLDNQAAPLPTVTVTALDRSILRALKMGLSLDAIARAHNTSERTVRRRVDRLKNRLGADTLFALGYAAARHGLID